MTAQLTGIKSVRPIRLHGSAFYSRSVLVGIYIPLFHTLIAFLLTRGNYSGSEPQLLLELGMRFWAIGLTVIALVFGAEKLGVPDDPSIHAAAFIGKYFLAAVLSLTVVTSFLSTQTLEESFPDNPLVGAFAFALLEVLLIAAIRNIQQQQSRNDALALSFKTAQYQALRAQLNPHFLFNTLNMISIEIEDDPKLAITIVDELSDLLRGTLSASERNSITLGEEIALLERYLGIQKMRFQDRFNCVLNIPSELLQTPVPPMLLQPLVENSLLHGFKAIQAGGQITVSAAENKHQLILKVQDNGTGCNPETLEKGLGLSIVQDNAELLNAGQNQQEPAFFLESEINRGTTVTVRLPLNHRALANDQ